MTLDPGRKPTWPQLASSEQGSLTESSPCITGQLSKLQPWPCLPRAGLVCVALGIRTRSQVLRLTLLKLSVGLHESPLCVLSPDLGARWRRGQRACICFGSCCNQLFGLERVFLGLIVPIFRTRGLDNKTSKSPSLSESLVPSHLSVLCLPFLPHPAWD